MQQPQIISDPNIMMGKPIIAGTRITVEHILEQLAGGRTIEQILDAHPHLTYEDVRAAAACLYGYHTARCPYPSRIEGGTSCHQ